MYNVIFLNHNKSRHIKHRIGREITMKIPIIIMLILDDYCMTQAIYNISNQTSSFSSLFIQTTLNNKYNHTNVIHIQNRLLISSQFSKLIHRISKAKRKIYENIKAIAKSIPSVKLQLPHRENIKAIAKPFPPVKLPPPHPKPPASVDPIKLSPPHKKPPTPIELPPPPHSIEVILPPHIKPPIPKELLPIRPGPMNIEIFTKKCKAEAKSKCRRYRNVSSKHNDCWNVVFNECLKRFQHLSFHHV